MGEEEGGLRAEWGLEPCLVHTLLLLSQPLLLPLDHLQSALLLSLHLLRLLQGLLPLLILLGGYLQGGHWVRACWKRTVACRAALLRPTLLMCSTSCARACRRRLALCNLSFSSRSSWRSLSKASLSATSFSSLARSSQALTVSSACSCGGMQSQCCSH